MLVVCTRMGDRARQPTAHHPTACHHEAGAGKRPDILHGVAVHGQQVRRSPRGDPPQIGASQGGRGYRRRRLQDRAGREIDALDTKTMQYWEYSL